MESLNKINGIVKQNQWICFLKATVLHGEIDSLKGLNRQKTYLDKANGQI